MSNIFEPFALLPDELQKEALREGEIRLQAQLQIAAAADQRALTWGGLLVAAATGALGGGLALVSNRTPDYILGVIAIAFSASIMSAAWKALSTVQPGQFCLPGNKPGSWLPSEWNCIGSISRKIAEARIEQAEHLTNQITENAESARDRATSMATSFRGAYRTIRVSGAILVVVLIFRCLKQYAEFDIWSLALAFIYQL
jgi:hypothetical protein